MKPKTLILMVVAVTCGLGASYMTSRLLAERQEPEQEKVFVLVAKKNLDMGLPVKNPDDLFELKPYTKGEEPKESMDKDKLEGLKNKVLMRSLRAGHFITPGDFLGDGGMASVMPPGYLAVGIPVNAASIAGGFASLPHSRVDIISTIRRPKDKDTFSQIILEDVLVLAVDQQQFRPEGNVAMPGNVVTVALKPEDSLKVTIARELGPLSLVLRKFNDKSRANVRKVTVEQILNGTTGQKDTEDSQPPVAKVDLPALPKTKPIEVAQAPEKPKGRLHRMRIIEGDKERVVDFWLDDNGQVVEPDVVRPELPVPPRPPQVQPARPPRPQTPAPAPKAEGKDDGKF